MTDSDSIFQEIDESLRVDKLQHFWENSGNLVIAGCVGIVLLTIVSVLWKNHLHQLHTEQTGILLQSDKFIQSSKYTDAIPLLKSIEYNSSELAVITKLRLAEAYAKSGDLQKSLATYSEIVGDSHADIVLRDFAALQSSIIAGNLHTSFDIGKAGEAARPFAVSIDEVTAAHLLEQGKNKEAAALLKPITADNTDPNSERARAMELLDATGENK